MNIISIQVFSFHSVVSGCADTLIVNPGHSLMCKRKLLNYGFTTGLALSLFYLKLISISNVLQLLNFIIKGY